MVDEGGEIPNTTSSSVAYSGHNLDEEELRFAPPGYAPFSTPSREADH